MQDKKASEKYLIGGVVASMFIWGLSWPSSKVLTGYCSAVNFTIYRYAAVFLSVWIFLLLLGIKRGISKGGIPAVVASGILLAVYSLLFFMGLKAGSAGAGGVLVTTLNPVMSYMIGIFLSRKLPSRNEQLGLVLGIAAGCVMLKVWAGSASLLDSGNLYFLLAAFSWAVMSKFTSRAGRYGSSLSFSLWQYMVTLLCLLPFVNVPEIHTTVHIHAFTFWANLVFSSVIVTALATTIYFYSTTKLGAEKASSFILLVPLAAAVFSWLLLGEQILLHTAIGGLLGMGAVYMINKKAPAGAVEPVPE